RKAYAEGVKRPKGQSPDPPGFYPESSVDDDLALGAAVLSQATGEASFRDDALSHARRLKKTGELYWGDVTNLALMETALVYPEGSSERAEIAAKLHGGVQDVASTDQKPTGPGASFRYALQRFGNGSVEQSLGAAASCLASRRLGGNEVCADVARNQLHWLFGQ